MLHRQLFLDASKVIVTPIPGCNPLLWREDLGFGYLKSDGFVYDDDYWENYRRLSADPTGIGAQLTSYRKSFVSKHLSDLSCHCDVGIGSGEFVEAARCWGYDVNPAAIKWLNDERRYGDPYQERFESLSFWDVLEHIDDPQPILEATDHVFVSLPIHQSLESCLTSKHLKPNEHIWQFTDRGFCNFMKLFGFSLVDKGDGETRAGREAIQTYYFNRSR